MSKIGFIGAGNMGGALITAACKSIDPQEVLITDHNISKCKKLSGETGCKIAYSAQDVAEEAEFIVLAVKPASICPTAYSIAPCLKRFAYTGQKKVIVTIAAGVNISSIKESLDINIPIIRIMPNTPVMVGQGMILITGNVSEALFSEFTNILKAAGEFERIEEKAMDCTTSVNGCAPAYVYMFIEAMADGAVQMGVPRAQAIRLAAKTVQGAAAMVLKTGQHPEKLKDDVCSPGGSTIVGVTTLEQYGFRNAVAQSIIKSTEKNLDLGK